MFWSFPLCSCGVGYRQLRMILSGNLKGRTTQKMGFPSPAVTYLAENLSGLKNFCSLSFMNRELFCLPLIFSILLPSTLRPGIFLSLSFYCSFLYFHIFFLSFLSISSFSFFSLLLLHSFLWEIRF